MTYKISKTKILGAMYARKQKEYAKVISERKAERLQNEMSDLFSKLDALYWAKRYENADPWTFETICD